MANGPLVYYFAKMILKRMLLESDKHTLSNMEITEAWKFS